MDLTALSLREAARHLRQGDIWAETYAKALLAASDAGAALNAFISLDHERVLRDARRADRLRMGGRPCGALHGIPIAIKDVFDVAGTPTTAGTPALRDHVPDRTAPLPEILFDAGAFMLGKTNMHEMAFGITSSNEFTGAVRNPYDPALSPGGSSGGTAVAVAARMAPAGLGGDTSGSIRIPAAHCGIVGYRPSTGRYPGEGMVPMCHTRDTSGLMARRVDDIALLDRVIVGGDEARPADLRGLRIGLPGDYFFDGLDSGIAMAFDAEVERLTDLGAVFVDAAPPDFATLRRETTGAIMAWEMPRDVDQYLANARCPMMFEDLVAAVASPYVKSEMQGLLVADSTLEHRYREAVSVILPRFRAEYETYLRENGLQAIAYPTTPQPPPPLGVNDVVQGIGAPVSVWLNLRNAIPATLLGAPSLSLPVGLTRDGLSVGFALDGRPGRDRELLSIGLAWEAQARRMPSPPLPVVAHDRTVPKALAGQMQ